MLTLELAGDFQQRHFAATQSELWLIIRHYQTELKSKGFQWKMEAKNMLNAWRHDGSAVQMTWTDDRPDRE